MTVNALDNQPPFFVSDLKSNWTVFVGDSFKYELPSVSDPELNDEIEVLVTSLAGSEFPSFVTYLSEFNVIQFSNITKSHSGKTFQFAINVKEKNSDSVFTSYNASVYVNG